MSVGIVQAAILQRPVGHLGPRTYMEANSGREMMISRDGELTRGQSVTPPARSLSRRRIARADESEATAGTRPLRRHEEEDFSKLGFIAMMMLQFDENERD